MYQGKPSHNSQNFRQAPLLAVLLIWACNVGTDNPLPEPTPRPTPIPASEICDDIIDNDGDAFADCDDDDCFDDPICQGTATETSCTDQIDNDSDTLVDCFDPDCDTDPACIEDCTNGVDDDNDLAVDCDDLDCLTAPNCPYGATCTAATILGCGDSDSWTNVGGPSNMDFYLCSGWDESGPERAYAFSRPDSGRVVARLSEMTADLDLFLLEGACAAYACTDFGGREIDFVASANTTYNLSVDGYLGATSPYTIKTACPAQTPTCVPDFAIGCGDLDAYTNFGGTTGINSWVCSTWDESGPEYIYSFVPPTSGWAASRLTTFGGDVDLFVSEGDCDGSSCTAYGGRAASFATNQNATYFLTVDGFAGATADYELEVRCGNAAGGCVADWTIGCGEADSWRNSYSTVSRVDTYACSAWDESGPEVRYAFSVPTTTNVTATLSGMTADLDLFLTENGCDANHCTDVGGTQVVFTATPGIDYFLVVEGYFGAISDYTLTITCN